MPQNSEKSEIYKYFYELFKSDTAEGSAVITDKQVVFIQKSTMNKDAARRHDELIDYITHKIDMPTNELHYNEKNCHFFCAANQFNIALPDSDEGHIGLSQYMFINDIIDAYEDVLKTKHYTPTLTLIAKDINDEKDIAKMREKLKEKLRTRMFPQKQTIYEKQRNK